jgi:molecular chaperone DnaK
VALSAKEDATIELNDVVRGDGGVFLQTTFLLKRGDLERIALPLIERTLETCRFSIETIGLKLNEIERIILVGGSTRMPLVVRKVEEYFKKPATGRVNPDEVVALGAAIQASALSRVGRDKVAVPPTPSPFAPVPSRPPTVPPFAPVVSAAVTARPPAPDPTISSLDESRRPTPLGSPALGASASPTPPPSGPGLDGEDEANLRPPSIPPPNIPEFDAELVLPKTSQRPAAKNPPPLPSKAQRPGEQTRLPTANTVPKPAPISTGLVSASGPASGRPSAAAPINDPPSGRYSQHAPVNTGGQARSPGSSLPPRSNPDMSISRRPPPLLIDVTPISLGVETAGGFCDFLISANTPVPCDRTRVFLTASDGQTTVVVKVAQGESERFEENTYLGDLHLTGLVPAARGEVQVAVTFEIDVDGILNVRAKDEGSGRETAARLHMVGTQSEAGEVQEMMARQTRQELG